MTRVLYLTPGCFDKGGISRYSRYQISAWRDLLGHGNVAVYSLLGPAADSFETPIDVEWHGGAALSAQDKARFVIRAARDSLRSHPDIVHAAHINLSAVAHAIARVSGAKSLVNVYGLEVWSAPRRDAVWGMRSVDHVISDCHFTAEYVRQSGLRSRPMSVIWDCVDISRFTPGKPKVDVLERYGIPDPSTGFNLLTFGRLVPEAAHKGYERLLEVFAMIATDLPQLRLIYGGRGALIDRLRARAQSLGLAERVYFLGMIDEADLVDVYRSAHLFSLVSDRGFGRGEGIPLTPLEAAATGLPILVGNQDGSQEAPVHEQTGFVLDPFDLEHHAAAIRQMCEDEGVRTAMAREAVGRTASVFSYARFVEDHRRVLRVVASKEN